MLSVYTEDEADDTLPGLSRYLEHEEPTTEVTLTRSDALWQAREAMRRDETEVAGSWLLLAGGAL